MYSTLLFCLKCKNGVILLKHLKFSNREESNSHLGTLTLENTLKLYD